MTPSLEDQLRDAARELEAAVELPAGLMERIRRRRRRRKLVTSCAAVAVVAIATVGAIALANRPGHTVQKLAVAPPAKPAKHHAAHPAVVHFATLPSPPPPSSAPVPAQFYGAVGAGDERLAVIDSTTGTISRYLQTQGSQALEVFNADRTIAYQPSLNPSCGSDWTATNLATGVQTPAFTTLDNAGEVALSSDGQRIAYVSVGAQRTVTNPDGTTMPAGCPTALESLVITDQSTGVTQQLPVGHFGQDSLDPAFDDSGNLLAVKWHGRIRVLDLTADASLNQAAIVPNQPGCDQTHPSFRPGDDELILAVDCPTSAAIDGYTLGSDGNWTRDSHQVLVDQPDSFVASYAYDASGQHLIYSVDVGDSGPQGAVYVVEPSGDRHLLDGVYQVAW